MILGFTQKESPFSMVRGIVKNRFVLKQMAKKSIHANYSGSMLGTIWTLLNPILLLLIYTFAFRFVFKARFRGGAEASPSTVDFALALFAGLIVFTILADMLNRSPRIISGQPSFVKKVVFPLDVLVVAELGAVLVHALVSLAVLFVGMLIVNGSIGWMSVLLPLILAPFLMMTLGVAWFLASLGVFIRDISQLMALLTTALMFFSPIFYPLSAVPAPVRPLVAANPLTYVIESVRDVLLFEQLPTLQGLAIFWGVSPIVMWLGWAWFQRTRKGFADVL